jgi:hypothetical protein
MTKEEIKRKHPIQPLELDEHGVLRFKSNAIVRHLLDKGGIDLNQLACMDFSDEDRSQFLQLIGYSHSGIPLIETQDWEAARLEHEEGLNITEARCMALEQRLNEVKEQIKNGIACLYEISADDL